MVGVGVGVGAAGAVRAVAAVGAVAGGVLLAGAGVAAGQEGASTAASVDQVATAIADEGWYADRDAVGDREQLADVAERLARDREPMGFALLAAEPPGSSTNFAEDVLDALPAQGETAIRTVVVLSDADVGVTSDVWSDDAIDAALDDTIDDLRADPTDGLEALADSLADQPSGVEDGSGSDRGGGGPNTALIVGGVAVLVALSLASRYRSGGLAGAGGDTLSGRSSWRRHRRSSFSRPRSYRRRSASRSSRRSSGSSRRGRGGRRL
jgi:hypothetical protein